jgi:50S ribosomal subunit-associated GTPase HflX
MHAAYYFRAHACIMVFDVTRKPTYKHLDTWWEELQRHQPGIPTIVVANKIDVDPTVTQKPFAFGTKRNLPLYFVSASDGTNVVRVSLITSLRKLYHVCVEFKSHETCINSFPDCFSRRAFQTFHKAAERHHHSMLAAQRVLARVSITSTPLPCVEPQSGLGCSVVAIHLNVCHVILETG